MSVYILFRVRDVSRSDIVSISVLKNCTVNRIKRPYASKGEMHEGLEWKRFYFCLEKAHLELEDEQGDDAEIMFLQYQR